MGTGSISRNTLGKENSRSIARWTGISSESRATSTPGITEPNRLTFPPIRDRDSSQPQPHVGFNSATPRRAATVVSSA
jgi:hypothetical protein